MVLRLFFEYVYVYGIFHASLKTKENAHVLVCTIHTRIITNKNPEICFRIRFRNGKANKFPQIFFHICFRNDHVGHAQATTAGHAYEIN